MALATLKKIISRKARRDRAHLQVEYIKQPEWYFCGPACLTMSMGFFGVSQDPYKLAAWANTNEEIGTTHAGMEEAARICGMHTVATHHATFDDLTAWIDRGVPVIVYIFSCDAQQKQYGELDQMHYIVIVGYRDGKIFLHDPDYAEGGRPMESMPVKEFLTLWRSERGTHERWMMVVLPKTFAEHDSTYTGDMQAPIAA